MPVTGAAVIGAVVVGAVVSDAVLVGFVVVVMVVVVVVVDVVGTAGVVGVVVFGVVTVGVVMVVVGVVGVVGVVLTPVLLNDDDATVVITVPSGLVVTTFADVRLPAESRAYCAVPVPPPQAAMTKVTLVAAISERARIVLLLHVN